MRIFGGVLASVCALGALGSIEALYAQGVDGSSADASNAQSVGAQGAAKDRRVAASRETLPGALVNALEAVAFIDVSLARFEGAQSTLRDGATGVLVSPCVVLTAAHLFGPEFLSGSRNSSDRLRSLDVHFLVSASTLANAARAKEEPVANQPKRSFWIGPDPIEPRSVPAPQSPRPAPYGPLDEEPADDGSGSGSSPPPSPVAPTPVPFWDQVPYAKPPPRIPYVNEGNDWSDNPALDALAALNRDGDPDASVPDEASNTFQRVTVSATIEPRLSARANRNSLLDDWVLLRLESAAPMEPVRLADIDCCSWFRLPRRAVIGGFPADRLVRDDLRLWADPDCRVRRRLANSMLATDCQATSGNSGGPVLVAEPAGWSMAGLITRAPAPREGDSVVENISYAISVDRRMRDAIAQAALSDCAVV